MAHVSIMNETRAKCPRAIFRAIASAALPKMYDLHVIFVEAAEIKKLNLIYRGMNRPTDILSFPLSDSEGEIYICPSESRKEAKNFNRDYDNFMLFLFTHGCGHLKG